MSAVFQEALAALARKRLMPVPPTATTALLSALPAAVRDQAFFSATVGNADVLQGAYSRIARILRPEGAAPGASMDAARARVELRQILAATGYAPEPGKEGTLQDLYSERRLNLIVNHNTAAARGRGQWAQTQSPAILDQWPCQELFRAEARRQERNWPIRWQAAGGTLYGDRMIARKDSPIWGAISRFGTPWPPFDFGSGMRVRDVPRGIAESLGVIAPNETVEPRDDPGLATSADVATIAPDLLSSVLSALGPRAAVRNALLTFA